LFTGIVEAQGAVKRHRQRSVLELEIEAPAIARELKPGDSVAVSGVCLTATSAGRRKFTTQVVPETVARTTLGSLRKNHRVNLELAVRMSDRLGGHLVQGHVDGTATAVRIETEQDRGRMWFQIDPELLRYMVAKGSVTVDGVALTLVEVGRTSFQVAVIPHTLETTSLGTITQSSAVNVEVDLIAKYVERFTQAHR
jgi:riboflavin synthase